MSGFEVAGKCQERLTQTLIACLLKTHWCLLFLKFEGPSPNPFQGIQIKDLFWPLLSPSLSAHLDNGSRLTPPKIGDGRRGKKPMENRLGEYDGVTLSRLPLV